VPGRFPRSIRSWRFRKIVPPALQRAHPLFSSQGFSILEKPAVPLTNGGAIETCPESAKADYAGTDRGFNPGADTGPTWAGSHRHLENCRQEKGKPYRYTQGRFGARVGPGAWSLSVRCQGAGSPS
jgi:hypothetical protein